MINKCLTFILPLRFLLASVTISLAQPSAINNIAQQCSSAELRTMVYKLASNKMQGRIFASHGDTLAARYVAGWFKQKNLKAPYANGTSFYQTVDATRFDDHATMVLNGREIPEFEGWQLYPDLPFSAASLPVVLTSFNTIDELNKTLPVMNITGMAVVLKYGVMADTKHLDSLEKALKTKGARLVIWSSPRVERVTSMKRALKFLPHYQQHQAIAEAAPLPELAITAAMLQELLKADNINVDADNGWTVPESKPYQQLKTSVTVNRTRTLTKVSAPNVIGMIPGTDPNAAAIIISAHHDHDGMNGKIIYPGAIDNASGSAAIMEVAALFNKAAKQGYQPKRTIIFASYTGEERGMLGSFYFAEHPVVAVGNIHAVINIDMLGRPDTLHKKNNAPDSLNYAYILVKDTLNRGLRQSLYDANDALKLTLDTYYEQPKFSQRRVTGSDQYPFYVKGVPFVRIDCGFVKEYHKPEDTPDKVNYELLRKQTQLAFLTLWNMASK